jgi:c-di-GMP-binding flagellar brake protein YcgR
MAAPAPATAIADLFPVGAPLTLEFERDDTPQALASRVEDGGQAGLTVGMPLRTGMVVLIPVGASVNVVVRRPDAAYALPTRVAAHRHSPLPLLDLTPTGPARRLQRRTYVRLPLLLTPTRLTLLAADGAAAAPVAAVIVDLSGGGVRLRGRQPFVVGQRLRLEAALPEPGGALAVTLAVVRIDAVPAERGVVHEAGCCFLDLTERERDRLVRFVLQRQAQQARNGARG